MAAHDTSSCSHTPCLPTLDTRAALNKTSYSLHTRTFLTVLTVWVLCLQGKQLAEAALLSADTNRLRVAAHTLLGRCCHALDDFQGAQQNYAQVCMWRTFAWPLSFC